MHILTRFGFGTNSYEFEQSRQQSYDDNFTSLVQAMVRVPGASHGIAARPSHMAAKAAHVLEWFQRHGGPETDDSP